MRYNQNVNVVSAPVVERGELALVTARSCNLFSLHLEASQSQSAQFNDVVGAKSEESLLSFHRHETDPKSFSKEDTLRALKY